MHSRLSCQPNFWQDDIIVEKVFFYNPFFLEYCIVAESYHGGNMYMIIFVVVISIMIIWF